MSNTEMLRVGMKVAMCGGGGKVLEIYGHSALINRQQKYPGGKVCSKWYIVEGVGVNSVMLSTWSNNVGKVCMRVYYLF